MSETLKSEDGLFQCGSDHAVEIAYMISCAEGCIMQAKDRIYAKQEVCKYLLDYMDGKLSPSEVMENITQL